MSDEPKDKKVEEKDDHFNIPEPKKRWSNLYLFPIFIGLLAIGILLFIIIGNGLV